jgi:hypothetical protein
LTAVGLTTSQIDSSVSVLVTQNFGVANGGNPVTIGFISSVPTLYDSIYSTTGIAANVRSVVLRGKDMGLESDSLTAELAICGSTYEASCTSAFFLDLGASAPLTYETICTLTNAPMMPFSTGCEVRATLLLNSGRSNQIVLGQTVEAPVAGIPPYPGFYARNAKAISITGRNFGTAETTTIQCSILMCEVVSVTAEEVLFRLKEGSTRRRSSFAVDYSMMLNATVFSNGGPANTIFIGYIVDGTQKKPFYFHFFFRG